MTSTSSSAAPAATDGTPANVPLTNPADLMALLGRLGACGVLYIMVISTFIAHAWLVGLGIALFSLFYQRSTLRMWRRLRDERLSKEAALAELSGETAEAAP